jgi:hypothetical protein
LRCVCSKCVLDLLFRSVVEFNAACISSNVVFSVKQRPKGNLYSITNFGLGRSASALTKRKSCLPQAVVIIYDANSASIPCALSVLDHSDRYKLTNHVHFPEDGGSYEKYHGYLTAYETRAALIIIGISH